MVTIRQIQSPHSLNITSHSAAPCKASLRVTTIYLPAAMLSGREAQAENPRRTCQGICPTLNGARL
jgi:hypothetical protein